MSVIFRKAITPPREKTPRHEPQTQTTKTTKSSFSPVTITKTTRLAGGWIYRNFFSRKKIRPAAVRGNAPILPSRGSLPAYATRRAMQKCFTLVVTPNPHRDRDTGDDDQRRDERGYHSRLAISGNADIITRRIHSCKGLRAVPYCMTSGQLPGRGCQIIFSLPTTPVPAPR